MTSKDTKKNFEKCKPDPVLISKGNLASFELYFQHRVLSFVFGLGGLVFDFRFCLIVLPFNPEADIGSSLKYIKNQS